MLSSTKPKGVQVGGINDCDHHCWIEDKNTGKVVGDKTFPSYHITCSIRNLDIKKPHYYVWENQEKWLKERGVYKQVNLIKRFPEDARKAMCKVFPRDQQCGANASFTWVCLLNENSRFVIRIGSMGWESKDTGKIFWEFG